MGFLITFEGGEASGKTTQAKALNRKLIKLGYKTVLTKEPGGTKIGNAIRHMVKFSKAPISGSAELLLFLAARAQLVQDIIQPSLAEGKIVICDRFTDSTLAYQGYGRGIDLAYIAKLNESVTNHINPDLTILLDVPLNEARRRLSSRATDRIEASLAADVKAGSFHSKVRDGYLILAKNDPGRWLVLNGLLPKDKLGNEILRNAESLIL
jgi:dTMP kinase